MISLHIAGMFAPSPASGWLADRIGAGPTAGVASAVLSMADLLISVGHHVEWLVAVRIVLLGWARTSL